MGKTHEIDVYVRFCETDAAGHVNNVSYFMYFEEARTKFFRELEMGDGLRDASFNFILASTACDYVAQAYAGQTLHVTSSVEEIGTKSFRIQHEMIDDTTDKGIAKGTATMVCFNYVEQKTVPIPDFLRENLESWLIDHPVE